ncbi:MAG: FAD-dependent monooxygenase [Deltaproteobacteria bacterium]|nr:FAD-dependent monooxygenase [Deltaproteobacteria bacterium]
MASRIRIPETLELTLGLDDADDDDALKRRIAALLRVPLEAVPQARIARRVIDARKGKVRFNVVVATTPPPRKEDLGLPLPREVKLPARVVVVGEGPCGLFCAYELARLGIASVVVDRGKTVEPRRLDLRSLNRPHLGVVDDDSNYCFGEGGAGTYSDGKLYTRATKRGDVRDVLETLARHDAPLDILTDARPHIGSNLLPKVITALRQRLEACGVRFVFGERVTGLLTSERHGQREVRGVRLRSGGEIEGSAVVLATGHSARDVYAFLLEAGVQLQAKPFALGVRIEHPQPLINRIQYGAFAEHVKLPSSPYRVATTNDDGGVFSFCMCPGGFIVPASTDQTGLVVNGMSLKRRDSPFANSGLVCSISIDDGARAGFTGPLGLLQLQQKIEAACKVAGGGTLRAPATRATDFVRKRASATTPSTSYQPGLLPCDLAPVLDAVGLPIAQRLRDALVIFDQQLKGYLSEEAVLVGVETRTSAPVRIPRDDTTLLNPDVLGLFPAGEGGGFAGGIVSAALDGMKVARAVQSFLELARRP